MRVNFADEKKEYIKKEGNKRKKEKHNNLHNSEEKQLRKCEKEV